MLYSPLSIIDSCGATILYSPLSIIDNVFGMMRSLTGDKTRDLPHSKPALYH